MSRSAAAAAAMAVALVGAPASHAQPTCEEVVSKIRQQDPYAPFVVGDSVTVPAGPFLGRMGFAVDAMACRTFAQGLEVMRARELPGVVVVALGSNAGVSGAELEAALELVGPFGRLVLVLPKELGGGPDPDGRIMRAFERAHADQVTTLDWPAYSAGERGWFAPDGLHITTDGAQGFAQMIGEAVEFGPAERVAPPPRPARPGPARPRRRAPQAHPMVSALWGALADALGSVVAPGVRLVGRALPDMAEPAPQDL